MSTPDSMTEATPPTGGEPAPRTPALTARPARVLRVPDVLLGVLPVIAGTVLVGLLIWENTRPLTPRYEARLRTYLKEGKFAESHACLKRLLSLNPDRDDLRFALAEVDIRLGRYVEGEQIMRTLAKPDTKGYLPAHLWFVRRMLPLAGRVPLLAKQAEGHLKILLSAAPRAPELKRALGELYARTNRPKEAIAQLVEFAPDDAAVQLILGRCWNQAGSKEQSTRYLDMAIATARKLTESQPKQPAPWVIWSQGLALKGDFAAAYDILERATPSLEPGTLNQPKAELCGEWANRIWPKPFQLGHAALMVPRPSETEEPLRVVLLGLSADPSNAVLTDLATRLAAMPGEAGLQARRRLEEFADSTGPKAAAGRLILGNISFIRGDMPEAHRQWARGYEKAPELTVLANNHAYALATDEPPDLPRALSVIDEALKRDSNDARLRFTRGDILARLGRDAEAETDLARALADGCADPLLPQVLEKVRNRRRGRASASAPPTARNRAG